MVIAADGTKWACVSCLKGHRVSGCNHTDRELKLVPKKGRPVTQCHHCRQERKKRSAHVKCDCAEPDKLHHSKEKCIHLREAEERSKSTHFEDVSHHDLAHLASVAEEQGCCCHHGGKCSCALLRKNSTDDETQTKAKTSICKPRLESTRSDSSITVFANGHHKPTQRNFAAHECGMPYKMPMVRSKTDQHYPHAARRSVDNLGLTNSSLSAFQDVQSALTAQSGQPSPRAIANLLGNAAGLTSNKLNFIDFAGIPDALDGTVSRDGSAFVPDDVIGPMDDTSFGDWPTFTSSDLNMPGPNTRSFPQNMDNNPFNLSQPALTAASSGTQSEVDEIPSIDDIYNGGMPSIQEDFSLEENPQSIGSPSQNFRRSLPPGFFGNIDFTVPDLANDFQIQDSGFDNFEKPVQDFGFNDPWQSTGMPTRLSMNSRPAALSVDSNNAPNIDVLKQLFPDMDLEGEISPQSPRTLGQDIKQSPHSDDGGLAQYQSGLEPSWDNASISIPSDAYTATAFLGQPYSHS